MGADRYVEQHEEIIVLIISLCQLIISLLADKPDRLYRKWGEWKGFVSKVEFLFWLGFMLGTWCLSLWGLKECSHVSRSPVKATEGSCHKLRHQTNLLHWESLDGKTSKMLVPGVVRHIWVTYPEKQKKLHSGKLLERKKLLINTAAQIVGMTSMPSGWFFWYLQKNISRTPTTEKTRRKKTIKILWNPCVGGIFLLYLALCFFTCPSPISFNLSTSHLLLNNNWTIDFSIWCFII